MTKRLFLFMGITFATCFSFAEQKLCRENEMGDSLNGVFLLNVVDFEIKDIKYKDIQVDDVVSGAELELFENNFSTVEWNANPENIESRSGTEYFVKFLSSTLGPIETKMSLDSMGRQIKFYVHNQLYKFNCK